MDFIQAYYFACSHRVPNLDIWDINTLIGHRMGSFKLIKSVHDFPWANTTESIGILVVAFTNQQAFDDAFQSFRFIHSEHSENMITLFLGHRDHNHQFFRYLVLK